MSARRAFDYALVRAVSVPTGDAVTLGAVLSCRQAGFLGCALGDTADAATRLGLDRDLLARAVAAFETVARGGPAAGPIGRLPPSERFHFLTATRSTALQTLPVRTGLTDDPEAALARVAGDLAGGSQGARNPRTRL
ncbi:DUF3037 domain-containing protein [Rubrivirga sp. IMCC43871]|uniref:DUF3037 domain-containing protein n=1 Tax=Rubrivirga sp. IMCC43871 TaxID=3391575 RepID=UPI0039902096